MYVVGGESLIDLVAREGGDAKGMTFDAHPGGSPYNCAIALSRLGQKTGFLCPISQDTFGDMLLAPLTGAKVHPLLATRVNQPSSLAVVTLDARGKADYQFYRRADRAFTRQDLLSALPGSPKLFQIGGFCAIEEEDAEIWREVATVAARKGAVVSIDPNVRPTLVKNVASYKQRLSRFFDLAHIIKLSDEDLRALDPHLSIASHAAAFLERPNCEMVVVTLGERGSRAFTPAGIGDANIYRPKEFGDTVGAGDSLMAGILSFLGDRNLLQPGRLAKVGDTELNKMLQFGAVVAGLNCAHKGCNPPKRSEVEEALSKRRF